MTSREPTMWGNHADRTGDADSLFLEKNPIPFKRVYGAEVLEEPEA